MMDLWTRECEPVDFHEVNQHEDDKKGALNDSEVLDSFFAWRIKWRSNQTLKTRSEVKKLMKDNINTAVEVATRRNVKGIL